MALTWETPPPRKRKSWAPIAAELRAHPGEWALVAEYEIPTSAEGQASRMRKGQIGGWPEGEFEVTCRRASEPDELTKIYARYVGEE